MKIVGNKWHKTGEQNEYQVKEIVAENSQYTLRRCIDNTGRELLLQIAADASYNDQLSKNAWFLTKLISQSDKIQDSVEATDLRQYYNYYLGFPELCDSTILHDQGARLVNVIGFRNVHKLSSVIPLVKIWKHSKGVDLPTSAWIIGKLLKIISFAHDCNIKIGDISGNNILIVPENHYVIIFNWGNSVIENGGIPAADVSNDIKTAAKLVLKTIIGNSDLRINETTNDESNSKYIGFVESLAEVGMSDARRAHQQFYELINSLCADSTSAWQSGFHKFTYRT